MITQVNHAIEEIRAPDSVDGSEGLLAIIIRGNFIVPPGVTFVSPKDAQQQIGFLNHKANTVIQPHTHNAVERKIVGTQEVLIVESGNADIDFYTSSGDFVCRTVLEPFDIVQLLSGGHGLIMREDCRMIEVKQGHYLGKDDKTLLSPRGKNG